jgi:hypothetical protein
MRSPSGVNARARRASAVRSSPPARRSAHTRACARASTRDPTLIDPSLLCGYTNPWWRGGDRLWHAGQATIWEGVCGVC